MVDTPPLANEWPADGPPTKWKRELGDGYSTIVSDGGRLYTQYRIEQDEFTVALDAQTGETVWEHKLASPTTDLMEQFGAGPHTTPLIVGDHLFTIGTNAVMHCYDKSTGEVIWKHDLAAEFNAPVPGRGFGCSPIAYKNMVIVGVDRKRGDDETKEDTQAGQSLMAFDQATGNVAWRSQDFKTTYASPILIEFKGQTQLVFLMAKNIMAVNPNSGDLLWSHELDPAGVNLATPLWDGKDTLFCSSAYDSGSRALKLTQSGSKTSVEQLWYSRKMRLHHGNVIQVGDYLYGSSGDFGPAFFIGLNLRTGKIAWRERGFKKATCVYADGKIILLDEDGNLALLTVTPEGLTVHSKCKVGETYAWAVPTLVGTTLYVRDRKHIMALDVG